MPLTYFMAPPLGRGVEMVFVKPGKNSIVLKNGKTRISVENRKFSRSWMTKQTSPLNFSSEI